MPLSHPYLIKIIALISLLASVILMAHFISILVAEVGNT